MNKEQAHELNDVITAYIRQGISQDFICRALQHTLYCIEDGKEPSIIMYEGIALQFYLILENKEQPH